MPLHTIKKVSELVPEAGALVKRASLETHLPTGTKDETLLSALELEYMMKVAHTHVDLGDAERVCRAVDLYGIADQVKEHAGSMVKAASVKAAGEREVKRDVSSAVDFVDSQLMSMNPDMEKIAEASENLWDKYSDYIQSDNVTLYAGAGTLVKSAALLALSHRAKRTGNAEFEKIASVIKDTDVGGLSVEDNRAIISAIQGLEKEAKYTESDLYTDMFMSKSASVQISLGRKKVLAEDLVAIADQAGDVLGADIGELLRNAHANKDAIEVLPLGELQVLAGLV